MILRYPAAASSNYSLGSIKYIISLQGSFDGSQITSIKDSFGNDVNLSNIKSKFKLLVPVTMIVNDTGTYNEVKSYTIDSSYHFPLLAHLRTADSCPSGEICVLNVTPYIRFYDDKGNWYEYSSGETTEFNVDYTATPLLDLYGKIITKIELYDDNYSNPGNITNIRIYNYDLVDKSNIQISSDGSINVNGMNILDSTTAQFLLIPYGTQIPDGMTTLANSIYTSTALNIFSINKYSESVSWTTSNTSFTTLGTIYLYGKYTHSVNVSAKVSGDTGHVRAVFHYMDGSSYTSTDQSTTSTSDTTLYLGNKHNLKSIYSVDIQAYNDNASASNSITIDRVWYNYYMLPVDKTLPIIQVSD